MFELVWKEKVLGIIRIQKSTFRDRAERMKFILLLEKKPSFVKVLECK